MTRVVKAECYACAGTGLYMGMCERPGTAVVCLRCNGTGCEKIAYRPFVKRRLCRGIRTVYRSRGGFLATGVGPSGAGIPYAAFVAGKRP